MMAVITPEKSSRRFLVRGGFGALGGRRVELSFPMMMVVGFHPFPAYRVQVYLIWRACLVAIKDLDQIHWQLLSELAIKSDPLLLVAPFAVDLFCHMWLLHVRVSGSQRGFLINMNSIYELGDTTRSIYRLHQTVQKDATSFSSITSTPSTYNLCRHQQTALRLK